MQKVALTPSPSLRYVVPVVAVALALMLTLLLRSTLERTPLLLFVVAVYVSAWYGGLRPALMAIALSVPSIAIVNVALGGQVAVDERAAIWLAIFVVSAWLIALSYELRSKALKDAHAQGEQWRVTLSAVGDAVMTTDKTGAITFMNRAAEQLTGWTMESAAGRGIHEVFRLVHEDTRAPVEIPVQRVVRDGQAIALSNDTLLIDKTGREYAIDDSAAPIRSANGRITGAILVFRDVSDRKHHEKRQHFLTEATLALTSSLDYQTTLKQVVNLAVPVLADMCIVHLAGDNGTIRHAAFAVHNPDSIPALQRTFAAYPVRTDAPHGYPHVIATGRAEHIPQVSSILDDLAQNDEHRLMLDALGLHSMLCVPMRTLDRVFGAITFATMDSGRTFDSSDVQLAEEITRRAANAIDKAHHYAAERDARRAAEAANRRALLLQAITSELSTAMTAHSAASIVIDRTLVALGGNTGTVSLVTDGGETIEMFAWSAPDPVVDKLRRLPLADITPLNDAVRTRAPVWVESPDDIEARYAAFAPTLRDIETSAVCAVPMFVKGECIGGIAVSFSSPRVFLEEDKALVIAIAHQCAQAIDRTQQHEALQNALAARRRIEETLAENLSNSQELYFLSRRVALASDIDDMLSALLSSQTLGGASSAAVMIFDRAWDEEPPAAFDVETTSTDRVWRAGTRVPFRDEPLAALLSRDETLLIEDSTTDERLSEAARQQLAQQDARCILMYPLIAAGAWYGLLGLTSAEAGRWDEDDTRHIQGLVDQAAVAIANMRLYAAEAAARKEAEHASKIKLQFLGMITHELRTPLTSIKGFTTTLLSPEIVFDANDQRQFLQIMDEETDKLADLVDQLLDLSRLTAGTLGIRPARVTIDEILNSAMMQLMMLTGEHRLVVDVPQDVPPLMADARRAAQVVVNLVGNAVKYTPPHTQITVHAALNGQMLQVNVRDEGPGIPPEAQSYVFEAFRRAEERTSVKGAGLGLAICKGLVEAHGGRIWISESNSSGTTISFTLPLARE